MVNVKYMNSQEYRSLEDLSLSSMELDLVHMGKEQCLPLQNQNVLRNG